MSARVNGIANQGRVPSHLIDLFNKRDAALRNFRLKQAELLKLNHQYKHSPVFKYMNDEDWIEFMDAIESAFDKVVKFMPYAPCPYCLKLGEKTAACVCSGLGWLTEQVYGECMSNGKPIGL